MTDPGLLVLSRSDIARLMAYEDYVTAVEAAFVLRQRTAARWRRRPPPCMFPTGRSMPRAPPCSAKAP